MFLEFNYMDFVQSSRMGIHLFRQTDSFWQMFHTLFVIITNDGNVGSRQVKSLINLILTLI